MLNFIRIFLCILIIKLFKKKYLPNKYKYYNQNVLDKEFINLIRVFIFSFLLISHVLSLPPLCSK